MLYELFAGELPFGDELQHEFTKYQTACVEVQPAVGSGDCWVEKRSF